VSCGHPSGGGAFILEIQIIFYAYKIICIITYHLEIPGPFPLYEKILYGFRIRYVLVALFFQQYFPVATRVDSRSFSVHVISSSALSLPRGDNGVKRYVKLLASALWVSRFSRSGTRALPTPATR
jgi:hypothetical protein